MIVMRVGAAPNPDIELGDMEQVLVGESTQQAMREFIQTTTFFARASGVLDADGGSWRRGVPIHKAVLPHSDSGNANFKQQAVCRRKTYRQGSSTRLTRDLTNLWEQWLIPSAVAPHARPVSFQLTVAVNKPLQL